MGQLPFMEQLEACNNELEVRENIAHGRYNPSHRAIAEEWLRRKESARFEVIDAKRDAREEETLSIAKNALSIAKEANRIASEDLASARLSASSAVEQARWARWAAIIAMLAAIIATKEQIFKLIFGSP